jgi:hypothetical protein
MLSKPALFRDFYASKKAQRANAHLTKAQDLIAVHGRPFATYKCIKEVAHLTKVNGIDSPVVFHSLADITQPRNEDDPFSIASWPCVLTGLLKSVTVCKISQKELFKVVQVNKRYSVIDLWNVKSLQDFNELVPLPTDDTPEFDMIEMRNSVPIPPFMFRELTKAQAWGTDHIALEAVKAMKEMMAESAELEIIMDDQEKLDIQEVPEDSTPEYLELQRVENEGKQSELNKSWQQLAEKCGLGAVLFFLNFDDANKVTFENVTHFPSVAETAFDSITSKLSSIFTVEGDQFTVMQDTMASTAQASPVQQDDDDSIIEDYYHGTATGSKRQPANDLPAPPAKRPAPISSQASEFKEFLSALTESEWKGKKKVSELTTTALLLGGSINGLVPADEVPTTGMDILQPSTENEAALIFRRAFARLGHPLTRLQSAQIKDIRAFDVSWDKNEVPKGMSNLCNKMYRSETQNIDQAHLSIIQAKQDSNTSLTDAEVLKLTKHTYHLPTTLVPLMRSLKTQLCLLKMFFGPNAFVCVTYQELMEKLAMCEQDMESMIAEEPMFPTYLLLRVDVVIRKFLSSVVLADHINSVSFKCIRGLETIGDEIEYDRFLKPTLPPWVSEISNSNLNSTESDTKPPPTGGRGGGKKTPKEGKQGKMIRNTAVPARLQLSRDEYTNKLANLQHKGTRPAKCVKWHCRGVCFDKCRLAVEGKPGHQPLTKAEEDEMYEFLKLNGLGK